MSRPVGVLNGNSKVSRGLRDLSGGNPLTSPNDSVLAALKELMGEPDFSEFFDSVYSEWRWKDYDKYSQLLRDKLTEVKEARSNRDRGSLHLVDTKDLTQTALFEAARDRGVSHG